MVSHLFMLAGGYVRILICGGSYERFLNLCANHRILLWDLSPAQRGYEANVRLADVRELKPLARKCRTRFRIQKKYGLPFFLYRHRKRKAFALGICCSGFFIYLLSCFVWNVRIEGIQELSRSTVLEYLTERGAGYGTWKGTLDCKQLAADLRTRFPNLTWVSVKMAGTALTVSVQENTDDVMDGVPGTGFSRGTDLLANCDGTIVHMITRQGMPQVQEGDAVTAGELLVLGRLAITDDAEEVVRYEYCDADADVCIRTELPYRDTFALAHEVSVYTGRKRHAFYANLLGACFGIPPFLKGMEQYDLFTDDHQLRLLRDFYLPFSVSLVTAKEYQTQLQTYTRAEALALAQARLEKFLKEKEEKGVQISEKNVRIDVGAASCTASGTVTVLLYADARADTEMIDLHREGT